MKVIIPLVYVDMCSQSSVYAQVLKDMDCETDEAAGCKPKDFK